MSIALVSGAVVIKFHPVRLANFHKSWGVGRALVLWVLVLLLLCLQPAVAQDSVTRNLLRLAGFFQEPEEQAADALEWNSLPQEVNLREEVEDLGVNFIQQGMRNSCAAFSATSMLELQLRRLGIEIDLSEQYVLWATTRFGADPSMGLTTPQLSRALSTHKICTEEFMPYKRGDQIMEPSKEALAQAAAMPEIRMLEVLPQAGRMGFSPGDILLICQRLAQYQPVCLSARWAEDGGTLSRDFVLQNSETSIFHMVLVIGYVLSPDDPMDGHLLIRNSWGLRWGDFGYAKIPFSYLERYGAEAIAFEFHWDEAPPGGNEAVDDSLELAGKFADFLSLQGGLSVLAFFVGLTVCGRAFGSSEKGAWGMLRYAISFAFLYLVLAHLSFEVLVREHEGEKASMFPLFGFLMVVAVLWRTTMRSFKLSAVRALGFLLLMLVVWNGVFLGASAALPVRWYADWRDATSGAVLHDYMALGFTDDENRAGFLRSASTARSEPVPKVDLNAERFQRWEASLLGDRSRMREDHFMAAKYYARRLEAYRSQRASHERRNAGTESAAAAPVDRKQVLELYQSLEAERASLDRADAAAVQAFNERAETYQKMKTRLEADAPTPRATEDDL